MSRKTTIYNFRITENKTINPCKTQGFMVILSFNNLKKIATPKSLEITGILYIFGIRNNIVMILYGVLPFDAIQFRELLFHYILLR